MDTTEQKLHAIVAKHLGVSPVANTSSLVDDLGADSLDVVELVIALEDEFGVEITDEAAEKVTTVGDFLPLLEKPAAPEAAAE